MRSLSVPVFAMVADGFIDFDNRYAVAIRSYKFSEGMIIEASGISFTEARNRYMDSCKQILLRKFYRKLGAI